VPSPRKKTNSRPTDPASSWRLECRGLSVRRGKRVVVHEVNLSIEAGQLVSLIGPNGSGKTTLMLALLGLLPPAAGSVRLDGAEMHRLAARRRGRFAAYVPQFVERVPAFNIYDVVAGGRHPHVSPLRPLSSVDRQAVEQALAECGLTKLAHRPINAVSGGERQKALIAAAIAQDARVMFLDEPNTALDPAYQVDLVGLLRLWHARGRGVVLISHDLQLPAALGGRVVALRAGRVVADGPTEQALKLEKLAAIYDATFETATTENGRQIVLPNWWQNE
jgi:iron complex transport system ATP-binding protein